MIVFSQKKKDYIQYLCIVLETGLVKNPNKIFNTPDGA